MDENSENMDPIKLLLTKITATENEVALGYHKMRGLYFVAVICVRSILYLVYLISDKFGTIFTCFITTVIALDLNSCTCFFS